MSMPKDATPDEIREIRRRRNASSASRAARKRYRQTEKGRAAARRNAAKRPPEVKSAHNAVAYALRTGKLVRGACEYEGPDCRGVIEAHHEDYSRKLDVRWLCAIHHNTEHGRG